MVFKLDTDGGRDEEEKDNQGRTACVGHYLHGAAAERQQAGAQAHPRGDGGAGGANQREHRAKKIGNADGDQL